MDVCKAAGTDKCLPNSWGDDHRYYSLYEKYLGPLRRTGQTVKLFEIGLGCDMTYGPGKSVQLWQTYLPHLELWEAEVDELCARKFNDTLDGRILVGAQGQVPVLHQWLERTRGDFDLIIDDGSHLSSDILTTFLTLFGAGLKDGGVYVIEDLQGQNAAEALSAIADWMVDLVSHGKDEQKLRSPPSRKLPKGVLSIDCFRDACAFVKQKPARRKRVRQPRLWQ